MIDEYLEKKILSIKNKSNKWPQLKWVSLFSPFFLLLFIDLCDLFILPNQSNGDIIVSYQRIYDENRNKLGYQYFTENGNKFKIHDSFIRNPIINIKTSIIV